MRVVVASDGSEDARAAVDWLGTFPLPESAHLLAVSVATLPYAPPEAMALPQFERAFREAAEHVAEETRAALATRFGNVEAQVAQGDPREVIVRIADDWAAELVVVGARGLGGLKAFVLGSVSTAVVRWAPCPVLVVKGHPRRLEGAVIAVDGSPDSLTAARFFADLPLPARLAVRLLAVVDPPVPPLSAASLPLTEIRTMLEDMERDRRAALTEALSGLEPEFRGRVGRLELSVVNGRPAETIAAAVDEPEMELVVVGSRGLGALKRVLVGSVSEQVLHRVHCPVLVVKRR